jgi:hypothetical protein
MFFKHKKRERTEDGSFSKEMIGRGFSPGKIYLVFIWYFKKFEIYFLKLIFKNYFIVLVFKKKLF